MIDDSTLPERASKLAQENGGHWGELADYPPADWIHEVGNGDTRLGYWEWAANQIEQNTPDTCQHCGEERGGGPDTGSLWKCGACNGLNES